MVIWQCDTFNEALTTILLNWQALKVMLLELNGAAWFMEKEALSLQVSVSHLL